MPRAAGRAGDVAAPIERRLCNLLGAACDGVQRRTRQEGGHLADCSFREVQNLFRQAPLHESRRPLQRKRDLEGREQPQIIIALVQRPSSPAQTD